MNPDEIIRPQEEATVWIYGSGHKNEGQVAPPNTAGAFPVIRTTVYRRDGRVEVWQRNPDQGPEFGVLMPAPVSYTDEKIAAQFQKDRDKQETEPSTISAPPTQPNIVSRNPDGSLSTTPNPNYTPPASTQRTPEKAAQEQAEENERSWNADPNNPRGSGFRETHLERRDREAKEAQAADTKRRQEEADRRAEAERNKPGPATLKPDGKGGTIAIQTMPDGTIKTTPLPGVPSDKPAPPTIAVNGVTYERGQDGKYTPAQGLPSEGEATAGGPMMPAIVADASERTLVDIHNALANDPTLTPKQRAERFQEAVQIANIAVQGAATRQRERESQRNVEYNVAAQKLGYQQTGMQQALDFVSKLNGSLQPGSDLGGKAFAALLGLQMLQMQGSGIDDVSRLPQLSPADLTNPARVTAANAAVSTAAAAAASPAPVPTPPNAIGAGAIGSVTAPGAPQPAAGPTPSAAPAPAAPVPAPAVPVQPAAVGVNPDAGQALGPTGNSGPLGVGAFNPDAGQALGPTGDSGPLATPTAPVIGASVNPDGTPNYGAPGMRVLPPNPSPSDLLNGSVPSAPGPIDYTSPGAVELPDNFVGSPAGGNVQMAPPNDFPVLGQQQAAPVAFDMALPPAVAVSQARATVPWRLDEQTYLQLKAAGASDEDIFSVPGVAV